jgi:hypothetical protein
MKLKIEKSFLKELSSLTITKAMKKTKNNIA